MKEKQTYMFLLALALLVIAGCGHAPYVPASGGVDGKDVGYAEAAIPGVSNAFVITYRTEVVSNPPYESIIYLDAASNIKRRIKEVCSHLGLGDWRPIGEDARKYFDPPCPLGQKPALWTGDPITCDYHTGGGSDNAATPGTSSGTRNYQAAGYAVIVCVPVQ
jgi:hypothetical protein